MSCLTLLKELFPKATEKYMVAASLEPTPGQSIAPASTAELSG